MIVGRRQSKKAQEGADAAGDMADRLEQELGRTLQVLTAVPITIYRGFVTYLAEDELNSNTKLEEGVDTFRGIKFDRWLLLFTQVSHTCSRVPGAFLNSGCFQYAFLLTREGQYPLANEILKHVASSNAFTSFAHQNTVKIVLMSTHSMFCSCRRWADQSSRCSYIACATYQHDYPTVIEEGRAFILAFQFNNDALRLTLACLGNGGLEGYDAYVDKNYQKFMKRDLGLWERAGAGASFQKGRRRYAFVPDTTKGGKAKSKKKVPEDDASELDEPLSDEEDSPIDPGRASLSPEPESDVEIEPSTKDKSKNKKSRGVKDKDRDFEKSEITRNPAPAMATQISPIALVNYAQISLASRSFQTARCQSFFLSLFPHPEN